MPDTDLHLPITFLHCDAVRALQRELDALGPVKVEGQFVLATECKGFVRFPADFYLYRMWLDWAREGSALRPFRLKASLESETVDATAPDPLIVLIEEWCDWHGEKGALVEACLRIGALRRVPGGLELPGFAERNAHLDPSFMSMQSKGRRQKTINDRLRAIGALVPKQLELLKAAGADAPLAGANETERLHAMGFLMNLDCALGREVLRPQEYLKPGHRDMLSAALECVRRHASEKLGAVVLEASERRGDPTFPSDPALIIKRLLE